MQLWNSVEYKFHFHFRSESKGLGPRVRQTWSHSSRSAWSCKAEKQANVAKWPNRIPWREPFYTCFKLDLLQEKVLVPWCISMLNGKQQYSSCQTSGSAMYTTGWSEIQCGLIQTLNFRCSTSWPHVHGCFRCSTSWPYIHRVCLF